MAKRLAPILVRLAAIAAGLYLLALLAVSATSRDVLLPPGSAKRFCGLYLDCHRMVAASSAAFAPALAGRRATGAFLIVTLELSSDARRATLRSGRLDAEVRDGTGRRWRRDRDAERDLARLGTAAGLPNVRLAPGATLETRLVFDVPTDLVAPQVRVWDDDPVARVSEYFLIGDEDSMQHARTWFALVPDPPASPATGVAVPLCQAPFACDTAVRVLAVEQSEYAGPTPRGLPADGVFYVITLQVIDADSGAPAAVPIEAEVRDARGRSWARAADAERSLGPGRVDPGIVRLAFDLPDDVGAPQLRLQRAGLLGRLLGTVDVPLPTPTRSGDGS